MPETPKSAVIGSSLHAAIVRRNATPRRHPKRAQSRETRCREHRDTSVARSGKTGVDTTTEVARRQGCSLRNRWDSAPSRGSERLHRAWHARRRRLIGSVQRKAQPDLPSTRRRLPQGTVKSQRSFRCSHRNAPHHQPLTVPIASPAGRALRKSPRSEFLVQFRNGIKQVGDKSVIGDLEDRRFLILVDGHDHLAVLHAGKVLDRS